MDEKQAALTNIDRGWLAPGGESAHLLEQELAQFLDVPHVIAVNSGSSAIQLAFRLLSPAGNLSVLCSNHTFAGGIFPLLQEGFEPVVVGSDKNHLCMDLAYLEDALKKEKAKYVFPTAIYGIPLPMRELLFLREKYGFVLVEDAAEAFGSIGNGRFSGTCVNMGILSFNGNKIVSGGGGGALILHENHQAERARRLVNQAKMPSRVDYVHEEQGFNFQMSSIQAEIIRSQLRRWTPIQRHHKQLYEWYKDAFLESKFTVFNPELASNSSWNHWINLLQLPQTSPIDSRRLANALRDEGVDARPFWRPMHLQPVFSQIRHYGVEIDCALFESGLCLPSGSGLERSDVDYIATQIMSIFADFEIHSRKA